MARAIFAVGHMLPAFSLLIIAAGVGLLLEEDPPQIAYWLACGRGRHLPPAARASFLMATRRVSGVARVVLLIATFQLARLEPALSPLRLSLAGHRVGGDVRGPRARARHRGDEDVERYLGGRQNRHS